MLELGLPDCDVMSYDLVQDGVSFTNLDEPLFAEADATKRDPHPTRKTPEPMPLP